MALGRLRVKPATLVVLATAASAASSSSVRRFHLLERKRQLIDES